jgi:DNA-binding transcriptional ArsR family regulator
VAVDELKVVGDDRQVETLLRGPRVRLLEALREQSDSATGLATRLGERRQTINYHLRQLEQAGLVELVEERGHGRCVERVLAPAASAFAVSPEALGPLAPHSRAVRDRASAEYLAARAGEIVRDIGALARSGESVATLTIETEIRFESAADRAAFARDLRRALARVVARHDAGEGAGRTFALLVAAHPSVERDENEVSTKGRP